MVNKEKHWTDDLPYESSGCDHKSLITYKEYDPHKGYSTETVCEGCNKSFKYVAGNYISYSSPTIRAVANTVVKGDQ